MNMKKYISILFLILAVGNVMNVQAKKKKPADEVKSALIEIFELCQNNNDNELAKYIVYRGSDKDRKWKDVCNADNADELDQVVKIRERINGLNMDDYKFVKFEKSKKGSDTWYVWSMKFGGDAVVFACLKVGDTYAIGDMD